MSFATRKEFEDLGLHYISLCEKEVCKMTDLSKFKLSYYKFDWSARRRSSRGGWYPNKGGAGISIAMHHTCGENVTSRPKDRPFRAYEYKSFDNDPVIGGFLTTSHEHYLAMVIAHEVAHAAQYFRKYVLIKSAGNPHGQIWKQIYAHLRKAIVNPLIPEQKPLELEYAKLKESITNNKKHNKVDWSKVTSDMLDYDQVQKNVYEIRFKEGKRAANQT